MNRKAYEEQNTIYILATQKDRKGKHFRLRGKTGSERTEGRIEKQKENDNEKEKSIKQ